MTCSTSSTGSLAIRRGDAFQLLVSVVELDSTDPCKRRTVPVDLTTAVSCTLTVKSAYEDTAALFTLAGIITNPTAGSVLFQFTRAHTIDLDFGDYVYDVVVTMPAADTYTVVVSTLEILPTVH